MNDIRDDLLDALIDLSLGEDIGDGDVTGAAIFGPGHGARAVIRAKEAGIICGIPLAGRIYQKIDTAIRIFDALADGTPVSPGTTVLAVEGPAAGILAGERTLLNFMQRLSGIATGTRAVVEMLAGTGITLLDTRKTAPGMRDLDKYAVRVGGGTNHRRGLFDMVMIKDNHEAAAGGITAAMERVRALYGNRYRVEIEAGTPAEAEEAAVAGADIVMLDNMDRAALEESIRRIAGRARVEISGNITGAAVEKLKGLSVDYISMGTLTHSVRAFDLSMKFL